jgi:glyoxylase-like metal-dependent hydrolase (beta-lactamase superfamily II)
VAELPDGGPITVAGLEITVDHAPGHTPGSVLFRLPGAEAATVVVPGVRGGRGLAVSELCLSGDVLFAGSIGRTDLPGGSMREMVLSLRTASRSRQTLVPAPHGPATTIRTGARDLSGCWLASDSGSTTRCVRKTRGW